MERSAQPRDGSREREVHPDEFQNAHQRSPEFHVDQVRFAREPKSDALPTCGKHGRQALDAHRGVDCMFGEPDRVQDVRIRAVEKPGCRVGPPRGSVTEHLFSERRWRSPVPATRAVDEFAHPHPGSGWNEYTRVKRSPP